MYTNIALTKKVISSRDETRLPSGAETLARAPRAIKFRDKKNAFSEFASWSWGLENFRFRASRRVDERCDFCRRLRHRLPAGRSQYSTLLFAPIVLCCIVLYCPNVEMSIRAARFRCLSFISSSSSRRGLTRIETMLTDDRSGFIKSRRHPNNKKRNGSILKA